MKFWPFLENILIKSQHLLIFAKISTDFVISVISPCQRTLNQVSVLSSVFYETPLQSGAKNNLLSVFC